MQPLGENGSEPPVIIRFFSPAPQLLPYFSTYYLTEVSLPDGEQVSDWLHPEWANLRFFDREGQMAVMGKDAAEAVHGFTVAGPTSRAVRFSAGRLRSWGIGILPLGWAKFVASSAEIYADRFVDGMAETAMRPFAPLLAQLFDSGNAKPAEEAARIDAHLLALLAKASADDNSVLAAHAALADPEIATVADLAARLNISGRSVERLSRRAFGFAPKLLLRRQRFLRTLAQVMLDPSQRWVSSLDQHYHDQAHFARDFQRFMGMSARQYMAMPHPFLGAAVHGRMAAAGAAMQALHRPDMQKR